MSEIMGSAKYFNNALMLHLLQEVAKNYCKCTFPQHCFSLVVLVEGKKHCQQSHVEYNLHGVVCFPCEDLCCMSSLSERKIPVYHCMIQFLMGPWLDRTFIFLDSMSILLGTLVQLQICAVIQSANHMAAVQDIYFSNIFYIIRLNLIAVSQWCKLQQSLNSEIWSGNSM